MKIDKSTLKAESRIRISGSKSESNRLLILQKLLGNIEIENLSNSQDTRLLQKALDTDSEVIDIHHAGTAMRFLTSFFAIQEDRTTILTGSERMKQRPIKSLVEALRHLGAEIDYLEKEGFPPLKIKGKKLINNKVEISANVSSQFITSLLLIGAKLGNGLELHLQGEITSRPYLEMTLKMLSDLGIKTSFQENVISVSPIKHHLSNITYTIESDWSSASYFYSLAAIGRKTIVLEHFKENSLQGDSILTQIYQDLFGVKTTFLESHQIKLENINDFVYPKRISLNMNDCPDIAQTLCVTATAFGIPFEISGLSTLKVKETDRLVALQNELQKIGCKTEITQDSIKSIAFHEPDEHIVIKTYNDHRMAMSFAPFALIKDLEIENPEVVEKSYPDFWKDFRSVISL